MIWYIGTGADQVVGPQFFLQTRMTVGVLMVMVVNALAFRPAYPLVIAVGFVAIYGGFSGMILNDPRTAITTDPLAAMTGMGVAPRLVVADMVIVMVVGLSARRHDPGRPPHGGSGGTSAACLGPASPLFLAGRGRPDRRRR